MNDRKSSRLVAFSLYDQALSRSHQFIGSFATTIFVIVFGFFVAYHLGQKKAPPVEKFIYLNTSSFFQVVHYCIWADYHF